MRSLFSQRLYAALWHIGEALRSVFLARLGLGSLLLGRGLTRYARRRMLSALGDFCSIERVFGVVPLVNTARRWRARILERTCLDGRRFGPASQNQLLSEFVSSPRAERLRAWGRAQPRDRAIRLGGDLLLLKRPEGQEPGVLLLKYNAAFSRFLALYDLPAILQRYQIVLEPSWVGYALPEFFLFLDDRRHVVVQAPHPSDFRWIQSLNSNLVPIRVGAGYWVDDDVFRPLHLQRDYAAIMVANWTPFKRHFVLFEALRRIDDPELRIALVGFPWAGYTRERIDAMCSRYHIAGRVDVFERVTPNELNELYNRSRVNLLLSRKEGASKVMYEGLCAGTPCIVTAGHESVRLEDVNSRTGLLVADDDLATALVEMQTGYTQFTPREWALENATYTISTRRLEQTLRVCLAKEGLRWRRSIAAKVNRPNACYKAQSTESAMSDAYGDLARHLTLGAPDERTGTHER